MITVGSRRPCSISGSSRGMWFCGFTRPVTCTGFSDHGFLENGLLRVPVVIVAVRVAPTALGKIAAVAVIGGVVLWAKSKEQNAKKAAAKGIPADRLGPSGRPKLHRPRLPSDKAAEEAARHAGKGEPIKHANPNKGNPHYHPTDASGKKIPGTHFEY